MVRNGGDVSQVGIFVNVSILVLSGLKVDGVVGGVDCPVGLGEVLNVSVLILSGAVGSAGETGAVWLACVP